MEPKAIYLRPNEFEENIPQRLKSCSRTIAPTQIITGIVTKIEGCDVTIGNNNMTFTVSDISMASNVTVGQELMIKL